MHSRIWGRKIVLEDLSKIGMLAQLAARSRQVDATGEVVEDEGGEGAAIVVDDNFAVGSLNTSCESSMIWLINTGRLCDSTLHARHCQRFNAPMVG